MTHPFWGGAGATTVAAVPEPVALALLITLLESAATPHYLASAENSSKREIVDKPPLFGTVEMLSAKLPRRSIPPFPLSDSQVARYAG